MNYEQDWLLNMLLSCVNKPALLTGVQSVRALENYIHGYIDACGQFTTNASTLLWYEAFMSYVSEKLCIKDKIFTISSKLSELGYSDEDAALYYMELLKQFCEHKLDYGISDTQSVKVHKGEIRVFRLSDLKIKDLLAKQICDHCAEYFGREKSDQDSFAFVYQNDGSVICALCCGSYDLTKEACFNLPIIDIDEKIRFEIISL